MFSITDNAHARSALYLTCFQLVGGKDGAASNSVDELKNKMQRADELFAHVKELSGESGTETPTDDDPIVAVDNDPTPPGMVGYAEDVKTSAPVAPVPAAAVAPLVGNSNAAA
jgi:hypothetical protein